VVTAFGRLGHVFASHEVFGIEPDMITFAKGVTSGYFPLGGVVISARLMDDLRGSGQPDAMFAHGLTYSSHPIGCAVAMTSLDLLEGGVLDHVRSITPHFQERLADLAALPLVADARGIGLIGCVECVATQRREESLGADVAVGQRIDRHCQALGLLVRPLINMCVMSPPLTITLPQIDTMFDILHQGIVRTTEELHKEGLLRD
jgi:adenosylmethionine-8-amino-7-oxononanoate aminotransferase